MSANASVAQNPRGTAKAGALKPAVVTTTVSRAPTDVAAAVAKSAALGKRKNVPKPLSEDEKRAEAEKRAAYRARQSYFAAFPVDSICVLKENDRSKLVLRGADGLPDSKEKALIELSAFRTVIGSRMMGEGNRGLGTFKPAPGEAKRSLGLAEGGCDGKELHPKIKADQKECVTVLKAASRSALGAWFDSDGIAAECPAGYAAAMMAARTSIAFGEPAVYHNSPAEVEDAEANDAELAERVRAEARQNFVDGGRIPFGINKDPKTKKVLPETAWVSSKPWPMKKDAWTPQLDKNRNKGPTLQAVPSTTANMPRLRKIMDALGHEFRPPQYENGKAPPSSVHRVVRPPPKQVIDTDELGNPILDAAGQPMMVDEYDLTWNPLFESGAKKKIMSLVQCSVVLGLSNGGQKGKYGVTLTLAGPIVITSQDAQKGGETYQYEDELCLGLYQDAEEGGEFEQGGEEGGDGAGEEDANISVTTNVNLHGLAGAHVPPPPVASTTDGEGGDEAPVQQPTKRQRTAAK